MRGGLYFSKASHVILLLWSCDLAVAKLLWFREKIDECKTLYSCADMCELIQGLVK